MRSNCLDDSATDWCVNEETKHRERILNFKLPYDSSLVGKGTISTREKQVSSLHRTVCEKKVELMEPSFVCDEIPSQVISKTLSSFSFVRRTLARRSSL
jgi:hypothetical protein